MRKSLIVAVAALAAGMLLPSTTPVEAKGGHHGGIGRSFGGHGGSVAKSFGGHKFVAGRRGVGPYRSWGYAKPYRYGVYGRPYRYGVYGRPYRYRGYYGWPYGYWGFGALPFYGASYYYYGTGCRYYWRMYLETGRRYWKYRYYDCVG